MTTRMAIERKFNVEFLISRSAMYMTACPKPILRDKAQQNIARRTHGRTILRNGRSAPLDFTPDRGSRHEQWALTSGDNLHIIGVHGAAGDLSGADGIR